jgi:hypothetical protein
LADLAAPMLRFRPRLVSAPPGQAPPPDLLAVGQIIDELMQPGHFFVGDGLRLNWAEAKAEDVPWEIFRGRLVDAAQTRKQARFLSWHVREEGADDPLLSVRLDVNAGVVHVTRGILCYVWEGYDSGGGVIESREVQRCTQELVGSAELARFPDAEELRDELTCLIWQAIVGTSRLPLHSVEAPLPAFSLGQLHYCYRPWAENVAAPIPAWQTLLENIDRPELSHRERSRLLESVLRQLEYLDPLLLARRFMASPNEALRLLRTVFNDASFSPYTHFPETALSFVFLLYNPGSLPPNDLVDFHGRLLRQLGRHLTAYDLVTFHHGGANYPDALLLNALLKDHFFPGMVDASPDTLLGGYSVCRLRRRALRQGWLMRRHYEMHPIPDLPTSPGENARVLPSRYPRVPEEQLAQVHHRRRRLFRKDPLTAWVMTPMFLRAFEQSIRDLDDPAERSELGIGLFIDRPLGYAKATGEPDLTPLLAHEAFSPSIALRRLKELALLALELSLDVPAAFFDSVARALQDLPVRGLSAGCLAEPSRPVAALADVRRVAHDFVIVRTLPCGLGETLRLFDFGAVQAIFDPAAARVVAMVQSPRGPVLGFFDDDYRCRLECVVDDSAGFVRRAGIELPVNGLRAGGNENHIPLKNNT